MGLSILIPVYNFDVSSLVLALSAQLEKSRYEGEIILLDDASVSFSLDTLPELQIIPRVLIFRNEKNEGRMRARRKLAGLASYDYLLFLDGDSGIISDDFLDIYFEKVNEGKPLVSGGRVYPEVPPADCALRLHWKYGRDRESRAGQSATGFLSNNFLIRKEIFDRLDDTLELLSYGHEDTWWGIQFEQTGIVCRYIKNPVLHLSLERAEQFIAKSEKALSNLLLLEKNTDSKKIRKHVRIYRWYDRLKSMGLSAVFLFFEKPFHDRFRKNLMSCRPRLFIFDCFRLAVLIRMGKLKPVG